MTIRRRVLLAFVLLALGSVIYVLFRRDALFVCLFVGHYTGCLYDFAVEHSGNPLCYFTAYCLSDALWYAALIVMQKPFMYLSVLNKALFWLGACTPFALELLQLGGIIPGTFDIFDIITYSLTFIISLKL